MLLTCKIRSYIFSAENEKEAYLKGCKKLAKYMTSKKYKNISFKIDRKDNDTFIFTLFTNLDLTKDKNQFCVLCKQYHTSFFVNEEYNCSRCNLNTFLKREEKKIRVSKNFYNSKIE